MGARVVMGRTIRGFGLKKSEMLAIGETAGESLSGSGRRVAQPQIRFRATENRQSRRENSVSPCHAVRLAVTS